MLHPECAAYVPCIPAVASILLPNLSWAHCRQSTALFRSPTMAGRLGRNAGHFAPRGSRMAWNGLRSALGGLLGGKKAHGNAISSTHYHITNPYHAVSIVPGESSCGAARELRSRRFLSREAPPLPLASCTSSTCRCSYRHFDDRRMMKGRRASDRIGQPAAWPGAERRNLGGRRQSDSG
jgi:hypothetical protein